MEKLFLNVLNMSLTASILILVVLLIRLVIRKAPKSITCLLWGLVGIRLIFPFTIDSVFSLLPSSNPIPSDIAYMQQPSIDTGIPTINHVVNPIIMDSFSPEPVSSTNPLQIISYITTHIWISGMVILFFYALISYFLLYKKVHESLSYNTNIKLNDSINTPFILGIIKPMIFIPSGISDDQMQHVIAHEQAHIKRLDYIWKPVGFLILIIHWFNPLVWIAYVLLCKDIEIACDEKVISDMKKSQAILYSQTLLECSVKRRNILMCPLAFGEVSVKERIKHVLNYKKPAFWIVIASIAACILVAICFLTNPKSNTTTDPLPEENTHNAVSLVDEKTNPSDDSSSEGNPHNTVDTINEKEIQDYLASLPDDAEELAKMGCFVITYYSLYGMQYFSEFMDLYRSNQPAQLTIGQYTVEGDVIFSFLQYNGTDITLLVDSRRDEFAGNSEKILTYHYQSFECNEVIEENGDIVDNLLLKAGVEIPDSDHSGDLSNQYFIGSFCIGNTHAIIDKDTAYHDLATMFDESTVLIKKDTVAYLIVSDTITGETKKYSVLDSNTGFKNIMEAIYNLDIAPGSDEDFRMGKLYTIYLCDEDDSILQRIVPYQDATIIDGRFYDGTANGTSNQLLTIVDEAFHR